MEIKRASRMVEDLMRFHSLQAWNFEWNSRKTQHGYCSTRRKVISLSKILTELLGETEVLDTILHEIAHALTPKEGHSKIWKTKALEIGCNANRTAPIPSSLSRYTYRSLGCGKEWHTIRRLGDLSNRYCKDCRKQLRNDKIILVVASDVVK